MQAASASASPRALTSFWLAVALLLAACAAWLPLWSTSIPPLLDYHNHLARQYILVRADTSELLRQWYVTSWHASPYLAFDGIVQALSALMPVDIAGKVFLGLMLLLLGLAPIALSLALVGRVTPAALLGLLFVHNDTVTLGFINYLFGIGFALCAAAAWIRFRLAPPWVRWLLFPLLCSLVFFSHLLGFVIYTLVIGSYELGRYLHAVRRADGVRRWALDLEQRRTLLSIVLQCALPLLIFAVWGPSTESVVHNTYGGIERKFGLLLGMFSYLVPPYLWTFDRMLQLALPIALFVLLVARRLRVDTGMLWPLGALLALFFAMPMELFSGWGADHRLLPALALLVVGSLRPAEGASPRWQSWAFAGVAALVVVRVAAVSNDWHKSDQTYGAYQRAFEVVPDGSRMYFAFGHDGNKRIGTRPTYHLPTLVLARRDVYVPYLFATSSGGFTLAYHPQAEPWQRLSRGPVLLSGASPDWDAIVGHFDYFLLVDEQHFGVPVPASLERVFDGGSVKVYRRTAPRAPP